MQNWIVVDFDKSNTLRRYINLSHITDVYLDKYRAQLFYVRLTNDPTLGHIDMIDLNYEEDVRRLERCLDQRVQTKQDWIKYREAQEEYRYLNMNYFTDIVIDHEENSITIHLSRVTADLDDIIFEFTIDEEEDKENLIQWIEQRVYR